MTPSGRASLAQARARRPHRGRRTSAPRPPPAPSEWDGFPFHQACSRPRNSRRTPVTGLVTPWFPELLRHLWRQPSRPEGSASTQRRAAGRPAPDAIPATRRKPIVAEFVDFRNTRAVQHRPGTNQEHAGQPRCRWRLRERHIDGFQAYPRKRDEDAVDNQEGDRTEQVAARLWPARRPRGPAGTDPHSSRSAALIRSVPCHCRPAGGQARCARISCRRREAAAKTASSQTRRA